jgi:hypothetical protein
VQPLSAVLDQLDANLGDLHGDSPKQTVIH